MYAADTDNSPSDTIAWNPIDDMEVTRVHMSAHVMPCAFPNNVRHLRRLHSNKTAALIKANDRGEILTRARQNLLDRQKLCASAALKKRRLLKNAKKKTNAPKKKRKPSTIGETIDPYLVFDAQGNMLVTELLSTPQSSSIESLVQRPVYDSPMNFVEYSKQANL